MTAEERAELYRDSADAILVVGRNGGSVPDGYRLEYLASRTDSRNPPTWNRIDSIDGEFLYRLVELPKPNVPTYKPHTRETWPDWRYLKTHEGNAAVFGPISNIGVRVLWPNDANTVLTWDELSTCSVSNSSHGPWEIGGVKE